jgi:hypothetical protein
MRLTLLVVVVGLAAAGAVRAGAQTSPPSPPPPTPAEARPDLSGTWSLDRSISSDPSKANFEATPGNRSQRSGGFGGGSRRRGGFGGFGGGRPDSQDAAAAASTPDERARLQALTDVLKAAFATLVISHHEPSFVINDAQNHTQFFKTDGSVDEHQLGSLTVTSTTHWEESRLVTTYSLSSRQQLVYTYTLLSATQQLVLRVRRDVTEVRRGTGPELKLVYVLAPAASK